MLFGGFKTKGDIFEESLQCFCHETQNKLSFEIVLLVSDSYSHQECLFMYQTYE